ncbi:P-loop NTPase [Vibrio pectenicida]|nr:P-loop NTPase [Vibrio pectenicida]
MMKVDNLSVLVAASPLIDTYYLNLAFAEQGITQLIQVPLEREQIIKIALSDGHKVVVLDVMGMPLEQAHDWISDISSRTGCKVVAIGDDETIPYYRSARDAGAIEYLVNPISQQAFASVDFHSQVQAQLSGRRVSVVGSKGGVGTSTIVASLAWTLSHRQHSVTVADLDFSAGDLDLHFDVQGNAALVEMLQYPERLEPVVFERSSISVAANLSLLTGYLPLDSDPFWPEKRALEHLSKFCLQQADSLIFDIPSFSLRDQVGMSALKSSDVRIVVVEPSLASIRSAGQILSLLSKGAHTDLTKTNLLVVNHTKSDKASLLALNDIHRALGAEIDVSIPFAPLHFLNKSALGQSAIKGNRKVSHAFSLLADKVTGIESQSSFHFWKRGA